MMTSASKKHFGAGSQGKKTGSGAMTDLPSEAVPPNMILSNRDKSQHSRERGQDSKWIQTEQMEDHEANKTKDE